MLRAARNLRGLARGARLGVLWLVAALWLSPAPAHAGESAAGYLAPASCPEEPRWRAALAARVPERDARLLASQLRVHIERSGGARAGDYTGTLASAGGVGVEREVRGQTCVEVIEALALVAVLTRALDADDTADTDTIPPAQPPTGSGWLLTRAQELALAEETPPPMPLPAASPRPHWGPSAFLWLGSPAAPGPSLDLGIGVHGEWSGSSWQPWLMLGAYTGGAQRARASGNTAEARFRHLAVQAVGCPWRFPRSSTLGLRPCLDLDLGRLTGEGIAVASARRRSWPWLSTGVELRLEWAPLAELQLAAILATVIPLTHPRFYFLPELTSFEVPVLGFRAGASTSLRF